MTKKSGSIKYGGSWSVDAITRIGIIFILLLTTEIAAFLCVTNGVKTSTSLSVGLFAMAMTTRSRLTGLTLTETTARLIAAGFLSLRIEGFTGKFPFATILALSVTPLVDLWSSNPALANLIGLA